MPDSHRLWLALLLLCLGSIPAAFAAPQVQSWTTSQGAKVMFVAAPELPMVDIRVVFDAGSARDGRQPGLASFTNAVLDQGAGALSADAIAERLESRGIELGNGALRDMAWYSIRSLSDGPVLELAVATLATILAEPRFAEADVERLRQQIQAGIRQEQQSASATASRLFFKALYGEHPYAHDPSGDLEAVAGIGIEDLRRFHAEHYVARNAVVAIVGDLERAAAEQVAEQLTAVLPVGEHAPPIAAVDRVAQTQVAEVFPSSQTHIRLGLPGMSRHDPDYFALYVGNHVLGGGGLVSLLGEEVRHKRGLSYSVYSYFSPMRATGPFVMGAQTRNDQAALAQDVMRETLATFITDGPGEDLLANAKQNIVGGFPLRVASNSQIVEYIAMMGFYDYPLDWLETLPAKVEAVTAEQVRDAFRRRLDPAGMAAVMVGGSA